MIYWGSEHCQGAAVWRELLGNGLSCHSMVGHVWCGVKNQSCLFSKYQVHYQCSTEVCKVCAVWWFGSYRLSYFCTHKALTQPIHSKMFQDETEYLWNLGGKSASCSSPPVPPCCPHLSSITVFKPYEWVVMPVVSATQMFAISVQLGSVK